MINLKSALIFFLVKQMLNLQYFLSFQIVILSYQQIQDISFYMLIKLKIIIDFLKDIVYKLSIISSSQSNIYLILSLFLVIKINI